MERLLKNKKQLGIEPFFDELEKLVLEKRQFLNNAKGNFLRFKNVLESIPDFEPSVIELDQRAVTCGKQSDLTQSEYALLKEKLVQLCPWRKGPFNFFGIDIDSEWQSWMKWDRIEKKIAPLANRRILDIGSSNGYYMFRMATQKPKMVLGLEPQSSFYFQYLTAQKFLKQENVYCLPVPHDRLPETGRFFDTVFCMGVLYHRKSPIDMLKTIAASLKPGGELVLENLVIESYDNLCLFPDDRYAKMRNVFFIPDIAAMTSWLARSGFNEISCVDITRTTVDEQRKTDWIQTETLSDFLDPDDPGKTIEGYPAPVRAVFTAKAV